MQRQRVLFWATFFVVWIPTLFVPLVEIEKPDESFWLPLGTAYLCVVELLFASLSGGANQILGLAIFVAFLHTAGATCLAWMVTWVVRRTRKHSADEPGIRAA